jgi:hypothetical protein
MMIVEVRYALQKLSHHTTAVQARISLYDAIMLPYVHWTLQYASPGQLTFQTYLQHHKLKTVQNQILVH